MSDDDGDSGTLTPEVQIRQLEDRLTEETERLVKLYDAYAEQEKEIVGLKAEIEVLEKEVIDKEIDREGLEQLLTEKDNRVRDLELEDAKKGKRIEHLEPELEKMEEKYPSASFLVTGSLGPGGNAHGPDEKLHIPATKSVTTCLAAAIASMNS